VQVGDDDGRGRSKSFQHNFFRQVVISYSGLFVTTGSRLHKAQTAPEGMAQGRISLPMRNSVQVALMIPCYIDLFYPEVGVAALELLEKLKLDVLRSNSTAALVFVIPTRFASRLGGGERDGLSHPDTTGCCGSFSKERCVRVAICFAGAFWRFLQYPKGRMP
jgi:hypothetical protein